MYKTIMVHVDLDDPGTADRVEAAADLATQFHATLVGVAAALPPATIEVVASRAAVVAAGPMIAESEDAYARLAEAEALFRRCLAGRDIETKWRATVGFPVQGIVAASSGADLVVLGPARRATPADTFLDAADVVMRAGRPVLIVPSSAKPFANKTIVMAWRNTRESRRALADALPLLATAGEVHLVHIAERGDDVTDLDSLADAVAFLAGHCIAAKMETLPAGERSPASCLIEYGQRVNAVLIVCGAYGHTRLREWALGGVTRDLFRECPVPCLFSH